MPWQLWRLSWREWTHHPWRHGMALLAVALGVALAWSVHLINASALAEFSAAVRAANGDPDLSLRSQREGFDDAFFERVASTSGVALASPVLELDTYGRSASGERVSLKLLGIDALSVPAMAPTLLPQPAEAETTLARLDPDAVFLNARARERLGVKDGDTLALRAGPGWQTLRVAGHVPAGGAALAVMDVAGAQARFGMAHRLTRIDLRLDAGVDAASWLGEPGAAAGRVGGARRRGRAAPVEPVARLPRQPDRAGAGGAVRRRLPGVFGGLAVAGAAPAGLRAARRARPDGARAARAGAGRMRRARARPAA